MKMPRPPFWINLILLLLAGIQTQAQPLIPGSATGPVPSAPAANGPAAVSLLPADKARAVCTDTHLSITFDAPPTLGTAGQIRVYDAADNKLVDMVDVGVPPARQSNRIGGSGGYHYYPVIITGNAATIYLHNQVLDYQKTYYVQVDPGVLVDGAGTPFTGYNGTNGWIFSTKVAAPAADSSRLVVAADGTGDFATVQGAVDFVPLDNTRRITIFIRKGTYQEIVFFIRKHNLTFLGEDRQQTIIGYADNERFNMRSNTNQNSQGPNHYYRASFTGDSSQGIQLVNLTLRNFTPKGGSQAEALLLSGGQSIISHVDLVSFQDTLQINDSAYIADTYIEGDTDYMWGRGPCFFYNCELKDLTSRSYYTQIRNPAVNHGYVYVNCTLDSAPGVTGVYLARIDPTVYPNSEVVFLNCKLGDQINPAGWLLNLPRGGGTAPNLANLHFWEYHSTQLSDGQPVDVSKRAAFSKQLTMKNDAATIANYSDPGYVLLWWTPAMAPIILTQPAAPTGTQGSATTFHVAVAAVPAPTYQWQFNGVALKDGNGISGAASDTLTLTSTSASAGRYTVAVTNSAGSVTSDAAILVGN